ncbi:hypothetical protein F7Q91_03345 [Vibrio chagasii]|uniref:Type IV secretion protein DotC n=2 Tax=Vibrio chagasii TaxID=170679 RepID=A0A7V7NX54_9VIBR|nr:hypothetical protein F7Q91_03345 [Vibrio chagasii]
MSILFVTTPVAMAKQSDYMTLEELSNLKGYQQHIDDQELALRMASIKESGEELGSSNGYIATMARLVELTDKKKELWSRLLPFESLVNVSADLNSGEAKFIVPGIVDEIQAHSVINTDADTPYVRTDDVIYQLRTQPKPVLRKPSWSDYFYDENKMVSHKPILELLPSNQEEEEVFLQAVEDGWSMGEEQAITEMRSRAIQAFVDATGMVRYINAVELNHLNKPGMIVENVGVTIQGNQMGLGTQYVSLDGLASWQSDSDQYDSPITEPRGSIRKEITSRVVNGELSIQEIEDSYIKLGMD